MENGDALLRPLGGKAKKKKNLLPLKFYSYLNTHTVNHDVSQICFSRNMEQ